MNKITRARIKHMREQNVKLKELAKGFIAMFVFVAVLICVALVVR